MRIVLFGNSGSGKSTLAIQLSSRLQLDHLDLDTLAWLPTTPPTRAPMEESAKVIHDFISGNKQWVIEGCYSDLLKIAMTSADQVIFLNPGTEACIKNAKTRPWEPHKYISKEEQDKNLDMLIEWIKQYDERNDEFSLQRHRVLFETFSGEKNEFNDNTEVNRFLRTL